ncbi:unnamed protein product [Prunus brigantina]
MAYGGPRYSARSPLEPPKTMIYPVRRLLRSRVWVAYADPGIKLRGLYICLAITTRLQSHEQSSGWQRELKCRLARAKVLSARHSC